MKKRFFFALFIFVFCVSGKAQIKFKYGIETGMNFNALPKILENESGFVPIESFIEYSKPALVIGGTFNFYRGKHFVINLKLQYRKMNHFMYHKIAKQFNLMINDSTLVPTYDSAYTQTNIFYHKICLPASIGFQFGKKNNPTIFIGAELNYFVKGKIEETGLHEIYSSGLLSYSTYGYKSYDPFGNSMYSPSPFLKGQLTAGISISVLKHFQISTSVHLGRDIIWKEDNDNDKGFEWLDVYPYNAGIIHNWNFDLSISYFFKSLYISASPN